ncbi:DUF4058 family protein [Limnochorda pilosa]|uniref:DUF4058 family protein n=1 Tax=Limnochorda pilosa TaxID=1555112 RepID=UPI0038B245BF
MKEAPHASPFPGMEPHLEHPALWPDVHSSPIVASRDELAPRLPPRPASWQHLPLLDTSIISTLL